MSGLRAKQKAIRHDRIIEAATRLFREQGYENVKMEAIAAAAEVAPAGGLDLAGSLLAIEERRRAIERGKASLDCLDQLRLDILEGEVSASTASRLAKLVEEGGGEALDPELRETVEEIRFRLRLEAARLARGGRRQSGG